MTKYRFFTADNTVYLMFHDEGSDLWRFVPRLTPAYINGAPLAVAACPVKLQDMTNTAHYMQQPNDAELEDLRAFTAATPDIFVHFEQINALHKNYLEFKIN